MCCTTNQLSAVATKHTSPVLAEVGLCSLLDGPLRAQADGSMTFICAASIPWLGNEKCKPCFTLSSLNVNLEVTQLLVSINHWPQKVTQASNFTKRVALCSQSSLRESEMFVASPRAPYLFLYHLSLIRGRN